MNLPRVLFVDDEPEILSGIKDSMRRFRRRFETLVAVGGRAALEMIPDSAVDIVVTDMRMPDLDGPELLKILKKRYPEIVRIVLSGDAGPDAVVRALPFVHQFLRKPCDPEEMRDVIERVLRLKSYLGDSSLRKFVGKFERLPSVPQTYLELTRVLEDKGAGNAAISAVLERDPAMVAKVLQLVNSAFFGLSHAITSVERAVGYLGTELLTSLVLTASIFGPGEFARVDGFSIDRLQRLAMVTALSAKRFMKESPRAGEAFTAGLVHDAGQLFLACALPSEFAAAIARSSREGIALEDAERFELGTGHAEIGAYILGAWGLPTSIVEAVLFHRNPSVVTEKSCEILLALHAADALANELIGIENGGRTNVRIDMAFLERCGVAGRIEEWRGIVAEVLEPGATSRI